jgi:tellurite resistance-related uncharacterized protein
MHRHDSLVPLSREHHHALVLAHSVKRDAPERLRHTLPADPSELVQHLQNRFEQELEPHFRAEEAILIPASVDRGGELADQATAILEQHAALRDLVAGLRTAANLTERLDAFGSALEHHVRFEERQWFVALERELGDELEILTEALRAHRMPTLPDDVEEYKRTDVFDVDTTPKGLRKTHDLKPGVWGQIVVEQGRVSYVLEDDEGLTFVLTPERHGVVAPTRPHHVEPSEEARFYVRFLRAPD